MGGLLPPDRFFQSALAPPDYDSSTIASSPLTALSSSDDDANSIVPELLDALPVEVAAPEPGNPFLEVIVDVSPTTQRTWSTQRPVLSRHSAYLRAVCDYASSISLDLSSDCIPLAAFQNFIDFSHSNIYSVNKCATDHHIVHTHLQSWVLGAKLEAPTYQIAALRELYTCIEPFARVVKGSAAESPIRVKDVDFVCRKTQESCVLRVLVFDAVAAHWTQQDAMTIGANLVCLTTCVAAPEPDLQPIEVLTWTDLCDKYPDFRKRISSSMKVHDNQRTCLLRPVNDYLSGKKSLREAEFVNEGRVSSSLGMRTGARCGGGHMKSPSRRRRSSSASSEGSPQGRPRERQVDEDDFMHLEDA